MKKEDKGFKRLDRTLVHKGSIIDYYQDTIEVPNGNIVKWDYIEHKGAAAIVAQKENGKILLVRQYRTPLDQESLELPAGGLNSSHESTKVAAMRELEEETGYSCNDAEFLISIYTTVAFCNEKIDIYVTQKLNKTQQNLDEDEFLDVEEYTIEEIKDMIHTGAIRDAKTISGLLAFFSKYH